ncbi:MAG: hypothetical protein KZQ70_05905 [gamma proteobacterium symbiont of Lucinoma myriamae]|nr:hypothetical protein [gamma proteobacterium symbiont of Lucinoma myriamae]MCU7817426.1 hypothetical protein [gamma proteobacterium symbiont of Lucinoma myriamae]MCU7831941.1 hypothetical protein [gamma proteobacterium symbiont of Lucinoma myriamae]
MDEDQYRSTYKEMNPTRCYFEKLLLLRYGNCQQAKKLLLAEREAFACNSENAQQQCLQLIERLRSNARFSLQITQIDGPLPHAKEIKVQVGGLFGLQQLLSNENLTHTDILHDDDIKFGEQSQNHAPIENIFAIINEAVQEYKDLDAIPYNEIVKSIISFKLPERKRRKKKKPR